MYTCPQPIAILLAVYNGEPYLRVQLDSIVEQTSKNWVLYIRDDASTDNTRDIIAEYSNKYENIVAVEDELGNLGCYENFRQLLRVVEAEYYMFSDADDYWLPEKAQVSYDFIRQKEQKFPDAPLLVHTDKSHADAELNILHQEVWVDAHMDPDRLVSFSLVPLHIVGGACSMFNRQVRDLSLRYTPLTGVSHDGWLSLVTSKFGHVCAIRRSMIIYRYHGHNTTFIKKQENNARFASLKATYRRHRQFHRELDQTLGYGSFAKYIFYRLVLHFKLKHIN